MSRLLPEHVNMGLFPGGCWLKRRGAAAPIVVPAEGQGTAALATAFAALLSMLSGARRPHLRVLVSDSLAAVTLLPWQESLTAEQEVRAYAHACFEQAGMLIDDDWIMQYGFRQFRAMGMAYALPHAWLSEMAASCVAAGIRLRTVLPVSASAYWRHAIADAAGQSLLLLVERDRLTALVSANGSVVMRDVQPVLGNLEASGIRLLKRVGTSQRNVQSVYYCDLSAAVVAFPPAFVAANFPDARVTAVNASDWI